MPDYSQRKAKIVCTLGPASHDEKTMQGLLEAGMDVCRLNFSHGSHEFHSEVFQRIRGISDSMEKTVAVMQDLQGPKIRVGQFNQPVQLAKDDRIFLYPEGEDLKTKEDVGHFVPLDADIARTVIQGVEDGHPVLFDDGKIVAEVEKASKEGLVAKIQVGGVLQSRKGMNLPGTRIPIESMTAKDWDDLKLGLDLGVDLVALSFVRSPEEIEAVRKKIKSVSNHVPLLISKIERPEAVEDADGMIEVSDGLLVARGDMAVEIGAHRVPIVQKRLIRGCNELGVPIITATQMLESMVTQSSPTRAEANDVANAVFDGTDALMLSGETASGAYPVESVKTMAEIIVEAEDSADEIVDRPVVHPIPGLIVDSIEYSAARIADHVEAEAIACLTHSGAAARSLAKYRPKKPIVAIMEKREELRKLALVWGVRGIVIPKLLETDDLFVMVESALKEHGFARDGDRIVVTAGIPTLRRGTTNMVKVHHIGKTMARDHLGT